MKLDLREFEWLGTFLGFTSGTYCIQSHLDLATALFSIPLQLHLPGNRKKDSCTLKFLMHTSCSFPNT